MKSRIILTAAELDIFSNLDIIPLSAAELALVLDLDGRATTRILDCLVTFDLLEKNNNKYKTTEGGSFLSSLHPQSILPSVQHSVRLWNTWSQLTATVREGSNPLLQPLGGETVPDEERIAFIGAMHVAARRTSNEIAGKYDLHPFKKMLDIGGGSGAYTITFLQKNPNLNAIVFDLQGVIPLTKEYVRHSNLLDRVQFVEGDYCTDTLPAGCDLAFLSAIIHQNNPEQNQNLYGKVYSVLQPGGVLLIRDHVMDASRTKPPGGAFFAINMLVNTLGGDTYTFEEIRDSLEKTGFKKIKIVAPGEKMDCLIEARKENDY